MFLSQTLARYFGPPAGSHAELGNLCKRFLMMLRPRCHGEPFLIYRRSPVDGDRAMRKIGGSPVGFHIGKMGGRIYSEKSSKKRRLIMDGKSDLG